MINHLPLLVCTISSVIYCYIVLFRSKGLKIYDSGLIYFPIGENQLNLIHQYINNIILVNDSNFKIKNIKIYYNYMPSSVSCNVFYQYDKSNKCIQISNMLPRETITISHFIRAENPTGYILGCIKKVEYKFITNKEIKLKINTFFQGIQPINKLIE